MIGAKKQQKKQKTDFQKYYVFGSFLMVLEGFRGSGKLQNSIRIDLDTAGAGLTLPNIEILQYSCFFEFQCIRNYIKNLPYCPGPPPNTFIMFSSIFQNDVLLNSFPKFNFGIIEFRKMKLWNV